MLYISKITIENIRLITKIELDLSSNSFIALVGKNNTGKSTILRAIDFFFSAEKKFEDLYKIGGTLDPKVTIEFHFKKSEKQQILDSLSLTKQSSKFEEKLVESGDMYYVTLCRDITKNPDGKIKINDHKVAGKDGSFENITGFSNNVRRILPKIIFLPSIASVEDYQNAAQKATHTFEDLFEIYLEGLNWESDSEMVTLVDQLKGKIGQKLNYQQIQNKILDFSQEVFEDISSIQINSQFTGVSDLSNILKKVDVVVDDGTPTNIQEKGSGTQRVIILALLRLIGDETVSKRKKECLFLLDEPEIHLHPEAQKSLASSLIKISKNHKVIISTHSHLMIKKSFSTGMIRKITKENNKTEDTILKDQNYYQELFNYLGFIPSDFLMPDNIILIEGQWDTLFLRKILSLISLSGDKKYSEFKMRLGNYDISFVDIGGDGNVRSAFKFIQNPENAIDFFKNLPAYGNRFCGLFDNKNTDWINAQRSKVADITSPFRINCISGADIVYMFPERLIKSYSKNTQDIKSYLASKLSSKDKSTFKRDLSNYVLQEINEQDLANIDGIFIQTLTTCLEHCAEL